jgi:photosystem II stability/assembly factor-like uncharacterized protein
MTNRIFPTILTLCCVLSLSAQNADSKFFSELKYRYIGVDGNRTIAVVGEAGNPMVSYVGAASGGIWKTEDAGATWKPIFDDQDVCAIGALAIAPTNSNHVWAGTGETFVIRPAHPIGNGVYKSTDAGKTWTNMGLNATGRIGRIVVHPLDTNIVYVAALGHTHAPQQERGVYKTTDGGKTWTRVFFLDENTGCNEIEIDPSNPSVLYAAMWQVEIKTWGMNSGGKSSGIYRSRNAGQTWEPLNKPNQIAFGANHIVGKTSVCVAPSSPSVVYALIEDKEPCLYRSANGGDTWTLVRRDHSMAQRASYYTRVRVSTGNPDEVYTICVNISKLKDGGKTLAKGEGSPFAMGGDCHDMWFDPKDANRQMVAHDGVMNMTFNGGKTWINIDLPIAQMYHVAVDNDIPYNVYGNRQDGYSYRGPSNSLYRGIPLSLWRNVGGCESGFAQPDPSNSNIVWSGCYDGGLDVTDLTTDIARDVRVWPETGYGWKPADMTYRWHWNFPMVVSKHNPKKVLVGSQYVHQTTNGGQSWAIISPDLTTKDTAKMGNSGGISNDNLFTWDGCTLLNMAESPLKEGLIWVGSNDGLLHVTTNNGNNWTNITANIPDLPAGGTVSCMDPSNFSEGTCYVSYRFIYVGNFKSYMYKTTDYGKTWTKIVGDLPQNQSSTIFQIKEDPAKEGLLWAGTDNGVYFSPNDGKNWIRLKNNLPPVPVYGIAIQKNFKDLVIGTYGRGFYILDDITPIREYTEGVQKSDVHICAPRPAYRFIQRQGTHNDNAPFVGQNPAYGASINYFLKDTLKKACNITILTQKGDTIRQLKGTNKMGFNRINWDLRTEPARLPKLKTKPREKDWLEMDKNGERSIYPWDLDMQPGLNAPRVPPGYYVIHLNTAELQLEQLVEVINDPSTPNTFDDIQKQYTFGLKLNKAIKETTQLIEDIERKRSELQQKIKEEKTPDKQNGMKSLEEKLYQIEGELFDIKQTGARQDNFRNPVKVLERLLAISKESINASGDHQPTNQQGDVYDIQRKKLDNAKKEYQDAVKIIE